jgi:hypothetical protein
MINKFLGKVTCKIQGHKWDSWKIHEKKCKESRSCLRCNEKETRTIPHQWDDWQTAPNKDEQSHTCQHCSKSEVFKIGHAFSAWQLIPNYCQEKQVCTRCSFSHTRNIDHSWGVEQNWLHDNNTLECVLTINCTHCKAKKETREKQVLIWQFNEQEKTAEGKCKYCGKIIEKELATLSINNEYMLTCPSCSGHGEFDLGIGSDRYTMNCGCNSGKIKIGQWLKLINK